MEVINAIGVAVILIFLRNILRKKGKDYFAASIILVFLGIYLCCPMISKVINQAPIFSLGLILISVILFLFDTDNISEIGKNGIKLKKNLKNSQRLYDLNLKYLTMIINIDSPFGVSLDPIDLIDIKKQLIDLKENEGLNYHEDIIKSIDKKIFLYLSFKLRNEIHTNKKPEKYFISDDTISKGKTEILNFFTSKDYSEFAEGFKKENKEFEKYYTVLLSQK